MINILKKSILFRNMDDAMIGDFLGNSGAIRTVYDKGEIIFDMGDQPEAVFVLLGGSISICKDTVSGKRMVMTTLEEAGDIFAEVFLFLPQKSYPFYTVALSQNTVVLKIPRKVFANDLHPYHRNLTENMLAILSQKAYNLTQKLQVLASGSLRQKLCKIFLESMDKNGKVSFAMTREQMADYLHVARPSLSRELANMQSEGLIEIKGRAVKVLDPEGLEYEL